MNNTVSCAVKQLDGIELKPVGMAHTNKGNGWTAWCWVRTELRLQHAPDEDQSGGMVSHSASASLFILYAVQSAEPPYRVDRSRMRAEEGKEDFREWGFSLHWIPVVAMVTWLEASSGWKPKLPERKRFQNCYVTARSFSLPRLLHWDGNNKQLNYTIALEFWCHTLVQVRHNFTQSNASMLHPLRMDACKPIPSLSRVQWSTST